MKNAFSIEVTAKEGNSGSPIYLRDSGDIIGVLFDKPQGFDYILATSFESIFELVEFEYLKKSHSGNTFEPSTSSSDPPQGPGAKDQNRLKSAMLSCINDLTRCDYFFIDSNIWLSNNKAVFASIRLLDTVFSTTNSKIYIPQEQYDEIVNIDKRLKSEKKTNTSFFRTVRSTIRRINEYLKNNSVFIEPLSEEPLKNAYADAKYIRVINKLIKDETSVSVVLNDMDLATRLISNNQNAYNQGKLRIMNSEDLLTMAYPIYEYFKVNEIKPSAMFIQKLIEAEAGQG
ncbi:MAG: hypothetical protein R2788_19170 [Saprospiraceae bacterium]